MSLFGGPKKEETSVIFDIASGTLAVALVRFSKGAKPLMLYSYREPIISKRESDNDTLASAMYKTLENVSSVLVRDGIAGLSKQGVRADKIDKMYLVFSSPWIVAQSKLLHVKKDKDVEVTRDLINSIVKDEEHGLEMLYKDQGSKDGFEFIPKVIERSISQISLNGYTTSSPYGKKAHLIEVPFFMTATSDNLLERVVSTLNKTFHNRTVVSHSCNLLSYTTLRDIHHDIDDFIFVDVHGELTDISVVKRGMLVHATSFDVGVNTMMRMVSRELKTVPQIAQSHVKIFLDGKSDKDTAVLMKRSMNAVKEEWLQNFHTAVKEINSTLIIPNHMFLVVGSGMETYFANFLKEEKFESLSMSEAGFTVNILSEAILGQFCQYAQNNERDSILAMHAIALNRLESVNMDPR